MRSASVRPSRVNAFVKREDEGIAQGTRTRGTNFTKRHQAYLIDGVESLDVVQDGIVQAALLGLLAALLRLVQPPLRARVAEILGAAVLQVMEVARLGDAQLGAQLGRRAGTHHVKHMVVSLVRTLQADPGLFQQVVRDVAADHLTLGVEVHFHEFAETRAVVVTLCLCIAERLQHRIRWERKGRL